MTDLSALSDDELTQLSRQALHDSVPKPGGGSSVAGMTDEQLQALYAAQQARSAPKPPATVTAPDGQVYDADNADTLKHIGGMTARVGTKIVTALPFMAMDAGVGTRNWLDSKFGDGTQYMLPSADLNAALDRYFGTPQGKIEKATDIIGPMVGGAAATGLPGAARTLAGGALPELGTTFGGTAGPVSEIPSAVLTPDQNKARYTADLLKRWQAEGGVVAPSQVNPTVKNVILETTAGKQATYHGASKINADVIDQLAAKQIGLNPDAPITPTALAAKRAEAAQGYKAIRNLGTIPTDDTYLQTLSDVANKHAEMASAFPGTKPSPVVAEIDTLLQPSFPSGPAVDKIRSLRDAATAAFKAGNNDDGTDYKTLAAALENQIDRAIGNRPDVPTDVVQKFRSSRQLIAQTHSIEDALVGEHVSGTKLASSGDPLTGNLKLIADMAEKAPKSMMDPNKIGSQVSHVDSVMSLLMGGAGEHLTGSGFGLAAGAAWPLARLGAKKYLLSDFGQGGAIPAAAESGGPMSARSAALAQALAQFSPGQSSPPAQ